MPAGFVVWLAVVGAMFASADGGNSHGWAKPTAFVGAAVLLGIAIYTTFWIRRMRRISPSPLREKYQNEMTRFVDYLRDHRPS